MPKNIALFIDGTWNDSDKKGETNVHKLYKAACKCAGPSKLIDCIPVACSGSKQVVHYLKGVGTGWWPIDKYFGGATGFGTADRIKEAYLFLALNYVYGDRVYLFGFSRGAFAARALAGFVGLVGLLFQEKATWENVARAYELYENGTDGRESDIFDMLRRLNPDQEPPKERPSPIHIHFIGVWDTVKALGLEQFYPRANWTHHHDNPELPRHITHARHALALHELRPEFEPKLWEDWNDDQAPEEGGQSLQQVWFPGAHADVGGGYKKTGLSDAALGWMVRESVTYKLCLDQNVLQPASPSSTVHYQGREIRPLAPRTILSDWNMHSKEKLFKSFFMHETVCKQLLNATAWIDRIENEEEYETPNKWEPGDKYLGHLVEVDKFALAVHLSLIFNQGHRLIR